MPISSGVTNIQIVAQGQLPSSQGSLYTPAASTYAMQGYIRLYNTNTTAETVTLFEKATGGTSREILGMVLEAGDSRRVDISMLGPGDDLRGITTTASKVNYTVHAAEVT